MKESHRDRPRFLLGIAVLICFTVIGGLVLGGLMFAVSRVFYLLIIFPIAAGLAGGAIVSKGIEGAKVHGARIGVFFGIVIGLIIYGVFNYAHYVEFINQSTDQANAVLQEEFGISSTELAIMMVDDLLEAETGSTGFLGFIKLKAQSGMTITRVLRGSQMELGTPLVWLSWLVELILITYFAATLAAAAASKPLCSHCNNWHGSKQHLGGVNQGRVGRLLAYLGEDKDLASIPAILEQDTVPPSVELYMSQCRRCLEGDSVLVAEGLTTDRKGKFKYKPILKTTISPEELT